LVDNWQKVAESLPGLSDNALPRAIIPSPYLSLYLFSSYYNLYFIHLVFLVISKSKLFPPFFVTDSRKQEEAKIQVQAQTKDNIDIKIINIPCTITIVY